MSVAYPYRVGPGGSTATATGDEHIAQMLEQLLFTSPGERVNRPTFGCGLLDLVFEPNSPKLVAGLTAVITASVQQWLGDLIQLSSVDVTAADDTLSITLAYLVRATGQSTTATVNAAWSP
jgi:uncharacterized protein